MYRVCTAFLLPMYRIICTAYNVEKLAKKGKNNREEKKAVYNTQMHGNKLAKMPFFPK